MTATASQAGGTLSSVPSVFDLPGAGFVLIKAGRKFPPIRRNWQLSENAYSYQDAVAHSAAGGNVGILAGMGGYLGLDQDDPSAFEIDLPETTMWETRPGRVGMLFEVTDNCDIADILKKYDKKPNLAQVKLFKNGQAIGEVKLQRAYQVIPPSYKFIDPVTGDEAPLEKGDRVDYRLFSMLPPAKISLKWLLTELRRVGIAFSEKESNMNGKGKKTASAPEEEQHDSTAGGSNEKETMDGWDEVFTRPKTTRDAKIYCESALNSEAEVVRTTPLGNRNDRLNKSALKIGHYVGGGWLDRAHVEEVLLNAAKRCGLGDGEAMATIASGLERGISEPNDFGIVDQPNPEEITEEDLSNIAIPENPRFRTNLEADNFVQEYIRYGETVTDSYPDYWFAGALFCLSVAANRNIVIKLRQGPIYPNVWINELGLSSLARKSTAIDKTDLILTATYIDPSCKMPDEFSPEAMTEMLDRHPRAYMIKDESAGLLAVMKKDYMRGMKDALMQLYDGKDINRELRTSRRKSDKTSFRVKNPYLCLLLATTPGSFAANTELLDVTSGWLPRFLHFFPNHAKDRWLPLEEGVPENQRLSFACQRRLEKIRDEFYELDEPHEMHLSKEAQEYFISWQMVRESELVKAKDDRKAQFYSRLAVYALKMGMLFTIGRSDYQADMEISLDHMKEACRLVDKYFMMMAIIVADLVGKTANLNQLDKIMAILTAHGGKLTKNKLMRATHFKRKDVEECLATLAESKEVRLVTVSNSHGPASLWVVMTTDSEN
jgi:hypothetical protein